MFDKKIRVPHPHSPEGRNFNWGNIGLPHPDSPASRGFNYSKHLVVQHPNAPDGQRTFADSIVSAYAGLISHEDLMPVFWKNIHDAIASHSYTRVYGSPKPDDRRFARYEEGSNYPDYPASNGALAVEIMATRHEMKIKGTIPNRSHYGDLSVWHSMAPPGKYTNGQVLEMIIAYAKYWYEKARESGDLFTMGSIAHMIADSYSQAHVVRSAKGIELFQSYIPQSDTKHRAADQLSMQRYQGEEGKTALDAVTMVLKRFSFNSDFKGAVEPFLRQNVYPIAPGRESAAAGGTDPRFAK